MGNPLTRAGNFTRPVTILRLNVSANAHNEEIPTLPTETRTLASLRPAPGTERFQSAELAATAQMRFVIRYRPDPPTVMDSIRDDADPNLKIYSISSVTEIGTREGWEILATARAE